MKNDNVLKTPQLLTKSKSRSGSEIQIHVTDDDDETALVHIQNVGHRDEFGWRFPEMEANLERKKNVIDMNWLNEFNDEIDQLQIVIKKERSLSFNSQAENLLDRRLSGSEVSELERSVESTHSFEFELPNQELTAQKKFTKSSDHEFLQVNNDELCSSTPVAEVFCSIRSCPSRDSGISASDDISENLPEIHTDRSLLEELEGVCENDQLNPNEQLEVGQLAISDTEEDSKQSGASGDKLGETANAQQKFPVWYKRFSIGQSDLILNFNTIKWGVEPGYVEEEISHSDYGKEELYDSLLSRSDKESGSDNSADEVESVSSRRRRRLRELWSTCDKLETLSLRGGSSVKGVSEVMKLVESLSKIDNRLEMLKCDLQSLTRQATDSRVAFDGLQKKTSNLITSTESSRHHMSQLFCLERLEERLQEEWWAVHYPELVTVEGNYMV